MTTRFIVLSCVLLFLIAPVGGWIAAGLNRNSQTKPQVKEITNNQVITETINKYLEETPSTYVKKVEFMSSKQIEKNWYLVVVRGDGITYNTVLCDFNGPRVIVGPGESLPQINISLIGVPYKIVDEIQEHSHE